MLTAAIQANAAASEAGKNEGNLRKHRASANSDWSISKRDESSQQHRTENAVRRSNSIMKTKSRLDLTPDPEEHKKNEKQTFFQWFFGFKFSYHGTFRSSRMLHPDSPFLRIWNVCQVLILMYIAFGAPVRIAFDDDLECIPSVVIFDMFTDLYFLMDIVLTFVTARMTASDYDSNFKSVAKSYVKSGVLVFDSIVSVPVSWISFGLTGLCGDGSGTSLLVLRLPRILRMARLLRVVKFVKVFQLPMFKRANPFVVRMYKLGFGMTWVLHFFACIYWYIKQTDPNFDHWAETHNVPESVTSRYIVSLYYISATLATVGYGDISGENDQERIFAIAAMVLGAVIFATVISSVSSLVASMSSVDNHRQAKLQYVRKFSSFWKLPESLSGKLLDFYYNNYSEQSMLSGDVFFDEIPASLRNDLCVYMSQDTLGHVEIFRDSPVDYVAQIFLSLTSTRAAPGEVLAEAGQIGEEMFIVVTGEAMVVDTQGKFIASISEGDVFGEKSLITDNPRNATVVAVTFCELYILRKEDFEAANERFPAVKDKFIQLAQSRTGGGTPSHISIPEEDERESPVSTHSQDRSGKTGFFDIPNLVPETPEEYDGLGPVQPSVASLASCHRTQAFPFPKTGGTDVVVEEAEDTDMFSMRRVSVDVSSPPFLAAFNSTKPAALTRGNEKIPSDKFMSQLAKLSKSVPEKMSAEQIANSQYFLGKMVQVLASRQHGGNAFR